MNNSKLLGASIFLISLFLGGCKPVTVEKTHYVGVTQVRTLEDKTETIKIIPRTAWTNEGPVSFDINPMKPIYRITIHHTAMPDDGEGKPTGSVKLKLLKILYLHKHQKNWADIGYHYIIDHNGDIWEGRNIKYQGAHAQGVNNEGNIGVVLIGNYEENFAPAVQKKALVEFVHYLKEKYNIKSTNIFPHEHFTGTKCPGKNLIPLVNQLRKGL